MSGSSQDSGRRVAPAAVPAQPSQFEFGDLTLDLRLACVRRHHDVLTLEPRTYDVLVYLVQHAGQLVSREALLDAIWTRVHVTPHSLTQAILQLRQALGDDRRHPRFIETVHRRGYRFIAPVHARFPPAFGEGAVTRRPSIAVLPFADRTPDAQYEWFADGITEEVIYGLSRIPSLDVIARTSSFVFKNKQDDVRHIAGVLGVESVLEGSVRRAANRVRVTGQLVSGRDGSHLWSGQYDGDASDVFAIQETIARAIADALEVRLTGPRTTRGTTSLAAYEAYLEARYLYFMKRTPLEKFRAAIDRAVTLDPDFALAHSFSGVFFTGSAWRGVSPAHEVMPLARAVELKALSLDPTLPEAHAILGVVVGEFDYEWAEAERHFREAIARSGSSRDIVFWYGNHLLMPTGRAEQAVDAMKYGLEADPLNLAYRHLFAIGLWHARRLDEAEAELRRLLKFDEDFTPANRTLGALCAQQRRFEEALPLMERAYASAPQDPVVIGELAALLLRGGDVDGANRLIDRLKPGHAYAAPIGLALFHAMQGEIDTAFEWAAKAIEQRFPPVVHLLAPFLAGESQWSKLASMMKLPAPTERASGWGTGAR